MFVACFGLRVSLLSLIPVVLDIDKTILFCVERITRFDEFDAIAEVTCAFLSPMIVDPVSYRVQAILSFQASSDTLMKAALTSVLLIGGVTRLRSDRCKPQL